MFNRLVQTELFWLTVFNTSSDIWALLATVLVGEQHQTLCLICNWLIRLREVQLLSILLFVSLHVTNWNRKGNNMQAWYHACFGAHVLDGKALPAICWVPLLITLVFSKSVDTLLEARVWHPGSNLQLFRMELYKQFRLQEFMVYSIFFPWPCHQQSLQLTRTQHHMFDHSTSCFKCNQKGMQGVASCAVERHEYYQPD